MGDFRSSTGRLRLSAFLAIAILFAIRSVAPPGYMLSASDDGTLTVTLCGGADHQVLTFDPISGEYSKSAPTDGISREDNGGTSISCPFAISAHFIPVQAPAFELAAAQAPSQTPKSPKAAIGAPSPVRSPLPARGPPATI